MVYISCENCCLNCDTNGVYGDTEHFAFLLASMPLRPVARAAYAYIYITAQSVAPTWHAAVRPMMPGLVRVGVVAVGGVGAVGAYGKWGTGEGTQVDRVAHSAGLTARGPF